MTTKATRRGRPPLRWLTGQQLAALPWGTAVVVDRGLKHSVLRGRIAGLDTELHLAGGEHFPITGRTRGRVVNGLFDEGDLVLRRGVPAAEWRGGVIRCKGREVYVESTAGVEWLDEDLLERVEDRRGESLEATG